MRQVCRAHRKFIILRPNLSNFMGTRGRIHRTLCMGPYAGADYNLTLCPLQSRLQHMYHGQPYTRVDLYPMPESTLSPNQGDFGSGLGSHSLRVNSLGKVNCTAQSTPWDELTPPKELKILCLKTSNVGCGGKTEVVKCHRLCYSCMQKHVSLLFWFAQTLSLPPTPTTSPSLL